MPRSLLSEERELVRLIKTFDVSVRIPCWEDGHWLCLDGDQLYIWDDHLGQALEPEEEELSLELLFLAQVAIERAEVLLEQVREANHYLKEMLSVFRETA